MALSATMFGALLGTFGGLAVHRWVTSPGADYDTDCAMPLKGSMRAAVGKVIGTCGDGAVATYVIVGIVIAVVLCHLWTWWMLRVD